jgi:hypothetical protein
MQVVKKFQKAVRITKILLKSSRAFQSKQQIIQNYAQSTLVEFLPERALKRIMNTNEAKLMTINMEQYQKEKEHRRHKYE